MIIENENNCTGFVFVCRKSRSTTNIGDRVASIGTRDASGGAFLVMRQLHHSRGKQPSMLTLIQRRQGHYNAFANCTVNMTVFVSCGLPDLQS